MYSIKRIWQFLIKLVEFRLRTWKNHLDINKAYTEPAGFKLRINKKIVLWFAVLFCLFLTGWGISALLNNLKISELVEKLQFSSRVKKVREQRENGIEKIHTEERAQAEHSEKKVVKVDSNLLVNKEDFIESEEINSVLDRKSFGEYILFANKADKKLQIIRNKNGKWIEYKEFRFIYGENEGKKEIQNDKKTPEGIYFIIGRKEDHELPEIYGEFAYILNYPNVDDRKAKRSGNGIWIHGMPDDSLREFTKGCIALENKYLLELSEILRYGIGVPVIIVNKKGLNEPWKHIKYDLLFSRQKRVLKKYLNLERKLASVLEGWREAWQSKDIDKYISFYDSLNFTSGGRNRVEWRQRKAAIFNNAGEIEVSLSDLFLSEYKDSFAVVKVIQDYKSSTLWSVSGKKILMNKSDGEWKIIGEGTFPKQELLL